MLIRVPFAVFLQFQGVYCLAVELLTSDQGIGLAAVPEEPGAAGRDDVDDKYQRVTSEFFR